MQSIDMAIKNLESVIEYSVRFQVKGFRKKSQNLPLASKGSSLSEIILEDGIVVAI